ncbi:Fic family protein [Aliivibrio fischeri]|uniref:Fic family protein n=1 Tax=Aliivibrio fischeri TaxID=668 RepID=UPI0007C5A094|nr:Fic family protein [Aliivibrio fischeri]MBP3139596.1 Fic family protein [Aliivibrio fischeri]MBP3153981.1 Fic family protein [Aliivibrio fischeri]MCE7573359.1 Fic family protein [Aliivibrio fischeri]
MNRFEIQRYIEQQCHPVSISDIILEHPDLIRRTLQRWLNTLIEDKQIEVIGDGRSRKYIARIVREEAANSTDSFPKSIPLSPDSHDILNYLDKSIFEREPVGYARDFLNDYTPNKTYYLSEPIRRQLHRMGKTIYATQPAGTYGRDIYNRLLIDLSWASSHLEGNTYSRLDTVELIEHGQFAQGKDIIETQMILNHKSAIELLIDNVDSVEFNRFTILNLHSALSENLLSNPFDEGRVRSHVVEIGGSVYKPMSSEEVLSIQLESILNKANQIIDPFEQSFFIMVHLPYLQPFADINKRTSRLAANIPLLKANVCPLTFLDVPEEAYSKAVLGVYEMNRIELLRDLYLWAYERSTKEYLAVKQELVKPDQLRLQYRAKIKEIVKQVILTPESQPLDIIESLISNEEETDKQNIIALALEELRRIHEGVLARYGLRPSQLEKWRQLHG